MGNNIKLPKPFGNFISKYFAGLDYSIQKAYFDLNEYSQIVGIECLRKSFGIGDNDTCCDCYLIIKANKTHHILMEDKDINSNRNRNVSIAKKQLEFVHKILISNNHIKNKEEVLAFICRAKLTPPLKAITVPEKRAKVLYNPLKKATVKLNNSKIEIFMVG
jgi:hypothetical protein